MKSESWQCNSPEKCERAAVARGLCRRHYQKARRNNQLPPREKGKLVQMKIWISPAMEKWIEAQYKSGGKTRSAVVREAIKRAMEKK